MDSCLAKNLFAITSFSLGIISLSLAIIVLISGRLKLHRLWVLLNISISIWGFGAFFISNATNPSLVLIIWRLAHIGIIFISVLFFHATIIFCHRENELRKIISFAYWQGFFFLFLSATNLFISRLKVFRCFYYVQTTGIFYPIFFLIWIGLVILAQYELVVYYRRERRGIIRNQIRYFFFGTGVGFTGGIINFLPIFGINAYPIGNLTIPLYCFIVTYAILRFRLMDIRVAITRAGLFVVIYTLVLGIPFVLATWYKNLLIEMFGPNWWMSPLILMAVLATVGPFIYIYISRRAEEKLLREQRRYQNTLKQASLGMTRIRNLSRLLNLVTHIVTKTVRISYAAIYLYNKETNEFLLQVSRDKGRIPLPKLDADNPLISYIIKKPDPLIYEEIKHQMQNSNSEVYRGVEENIRILEAAVIIPSFLEDRFVGFFVLGDKISGQIYTPEDLNVFQILASQAALAIENAQFYEEAKEMQEQIAQAEKMATIGTMADGLSHQINNRFNALSLIAGDTIDTIRITDTSKCTPEVKEMISQINRALERIQTNVIQGGEVVKGILKYTRKGEEGFEPLGLDQILDSTIEMVQFKVKLAEIDLVRDYPKDTLKIKGNLVQLQEAFFNFIDNAYDAIVERRTLLKEDGYRGRITVSAKPKDTNLEIIVEDNGMGVKDADAEKIFTPFFTTKTSSRKGTGLGLYVIRRIITDMHKGKISFESGYKTGTRFILELPLAK